jgi:hypothetical protein
MEDITNLSSKHNSTSIDGKQIIWTPAIRLNTHMKSEPLKRREQLKQPPRLKQKQQISKFDQLRKIKAYQTNILFF